jgi:tRNA uridine 5-carboxymethylaminomethyl modification enzyme
MYQIYLKRQRVDLELFSQDEALDLESDIDYSAIHGLSTEVKERLSRVRPTSVVRFSSLSRRVPLI